MVPFHPEVQEFFRGPLQRFTYKFPEITGIAHARSWALKHSQDHGTSFTYTTGGMRDTAFVEIRKKPVEKKPAAAAERATEHDDEHLAVACLPPAQHGATCCPACCSMQQQSAAPVQGGLLMSEEPPLSSRYTTMSMSMLSMSMLSMLSSIPCTWSSCRRLIRPPLRNKLLDVIDITNGNKLAPAARGFSNNKATRKKRRVNNLVKLQVKPVEVQLQNLVGVVKVGDGGDSYYVVQRDHKHKRTVRKKLVGVVDVGDGGDGKYVVQDRKHKRTVRNKPVRNKPVF